MIAIGDKGELKGLPPSGPPQRTSVLHGLCSTKDAQRFSVDENAQFGGQLCNYPPRTDESYFEWRDEHASIQHYRKLTQTLGNENSHKL